MAISEHTVSFSEESLAEIQEHLRERGVDGWLLYDFRGSNPITAGVLGLPILSRRIFVFLPVVGRPVALTHQIEQQPWSTWIGENRTYLSWQSLQDGIRSLLVDAKVIAAEYSALDEVPYLDRLPAGVVELITAGGARLESSGDLVSAFYSRWSADGVASHMWAAKILRDTAHSAFAHVAQKLRSDDSVNEWEVRSWIADQLRNRGLTVGSDCVVAVNANAANPHYAPGSENHSEIRPGDLLLIDLWGKEDAQSIYADQTWMAFVGDNPSERVRELWLAIRDARDAAVELVRRRCAEGEAVAGYEVDDAARGLIESRGYGDAFIHRTGHSIDLELHGSGPNADNLETRDVRRLIPGIGFSVEPGLYFPGEIGLRTEIDVYMGPEGPIVTTPAPQAEIERLII